MRSVTTAAAAVDSNTGPGPLTKTQSWVIGHLRSEATIGGWIDSNSGFWEPGTLNRRDGESEGWTCVALPPTLAWSCSPLGGFEHLSSQ